VRVFSTGELEALQGTQEGAMQDRCVLLTRGSAGTDEHGQPIATWTERAATACGFGYPSPREAMGGAQVPATQGRVRLPLDTDVSNVDRVRLTHRFGAALSPTETFEVVGEPRRGPSGLALDLKRRTGP